MREELDCHVAQLTVRKIWSFWIWWGPVFAKMMERENERQRETERARNETYVGRDMGFVNNVGSADV